MTVAAKDYLTINGTRYRVKPNGFGRTQQAIEVSQFSGKRPQSPFIDAEVIGFQNGEGATTVDDNGTQVASAFGFEPVNAATVTGNQPIKVGRSIATATSITAAETTIIAIYEWDDNAIYFIVSNAKKVYKWAASAITTYDWSGTVNSLPTFPSKMVLFNGRLNIALQNGHIIQFDKTSFYDIGVGEANAATILGVASTVRKLWLSYNNGISYSTQYTMSEGGTFTAIQNCAGHVEIGCVVGGTVYIATKEAGNAEYTTCRIFSFAADATGSKTWIAELPDDRVTAMIEHKGGVALGMSWGGSVRLLSGTTITEILHAGALTGGGSGSAFGGEAIHALASHGGRLYAAGYDSSQASGQRTWLRVYNGSGWLLMAYGGNDLSTTITAIARAAGQFYLGSADSNTDVRLYQLASSTRLTSATLDLPKYVFGAPSVRKQMVSITVRHSALINGQAVQAKYSLDDGSYVTSVTDQDIGATVSQFVLPTGTTGYGIKPRLVLTNVTGSDLIIYNVAVRCLPSPPVNELWDAALVLHPGIGQVWNDATADTVEANAKFDTLAALRATGAPFQAIGPMWDGSVPVRAMPAVFDAQSPLQAQMRQRSDGVELELPIKLIQAWQPANLVVNASFEANTGNNTAPTSWATTGTGTTANVDNTAAQDGTYGLKLAFDGASATWGRTQSISGLIVGRWYTLSGYIKRNALTVGNVGIDFTDFTSALLVRLSAGTGTDGSYVRYSGSFLNANTSLSGTLRCFGYNIPAGNVWFDAIQLEEGVPATTFHELGTAL